MTNKEIINSFYEGFARGDYSTMGSHYHEDVTFEDPAFGKLQGEKAAKMWEMLLTSSSPKITFSDVSTQGDTGSARWQAIYSFGPQKRKVVNNISAAFTFKDGKIIDHKDSFDLWKWSRQALGIPGLLLGWSPFIKNKVQKMANNRLDHYLK